MQYMFRITLGHSNYSILSWRHHPTIHIRGLKTNDMFLTFSQGKFFRPMRL